MREIVLGCKKAAKINKGNITIAEFIHDVEMVFSLRICRIMELFQYTQQGFRTIPLEFNYLFIVSYKKRRKKNFIRKFN